MMKKRQHQYRIKLTSITALKLIQAMLILTTLISKLPKVNGFAGSRSTSSSLSFIHTKHSSSSSYKRSHNYFHRVVTPSIISTDITNNNRNVFQFSSSSSLPSPSTSSSLSSSLQGEETKLESLQPQNTKNTRKKYKEKRLEEHLRNIKIQEWLKSSKVEDVLSIRIIVTDFQATAKMKHKRIFFRLNDKHNITLKDVSNEVSKSLVTVPHKSGGMKIDIQMAVPNIDTMNLVNNTNEECEWKNIETDEDVRGMINEAVACYSNHKDIMTRPSLVLQFNATSLVGGGDSNKVQKELEEDPTETESMTMISFYSFPPNGGIENPIEFREMLKRVWKPYHVLGRIYVAKEGVNAQMAIPTNILSHFMECCYKDIPELGEYMENGINIDPHVIPIQEYLETKPFDALHIRIRQQIVADGLSKELDWLDAGYDMPPSEWHDTLSSSNDNDNKKDKKDMLLFDCRNDYETSIGKFENAMPLETKHFRESWDVLSDKLQDVPKDTPIMTYCTGGIRCVKVGAYLTQVMNFTNVSRLAGGIIAYDRTMMNNTNNNNASTTATTTLFQGSNYVFDNRIGRPITNDSLATCITCACQTSLISNCLNTHCHVRINQCDKCSDVYHGTCSSSCKRRVMNSQMMPLKKRLISDEPMPVKDKKYFADLEEYSAFYSTAVPNGITATIADAAVSSTSPSYTTSSPLLSQVELSTEQYMPSGSHMLSGPMQGNILKQIASMTKHGRILELGTFTGYSTLCLLQGVAASSITATNNSPNPVVVSMERDPRAFDIAAMHLNIAQQFGDNANASEEIQMMRELYPSQVPQQEGNNITISYNNVTCQLLKVRDGLASLEEMSAESLSEQKQYPFDLVFLDADKPRLLEYIEVLLSNDTLLSNKGNGMIVVDNTLWKGLVLEASHGYTKKKKMGDDSSKKSRRARRLALIMHRFNEAMKLDDRVDVVLLPLRDGLSVIRKL